MAISIPSNTSATGQGGTSVRLVWSNSAADHLETVLHEKQKLIDSEVLRLSAPLIPMRTGTLIRSGQLGTVIGSGEVRYTAPYSRKQYHTKQSRGYDPRRGGLWFDRMKAANKAHFKKIING